MPTKTLVLNNQGLFHLHTLPVQNLYYGRRDLYSYINTIATYIPSHTKYKVAAQIFQDVVLNESFRDL